MTEGKTKWESLRNALCFQLNSMLEVTDWLNCYVEKLIVRMGTTLHIVRTDCVNMVKHIWFDRDKKKCDMFLCSNLLCKTMSHLVYLIEASDLELSCSCQKKT